MARDYARIVRALRAKADDPVVPEAEKRALRERADALEKKYVSVSSPITDDTTTTSRDGYVWTPPDYMRYMWQSDGRFNPFARPPGYQNPGFDQRRYEEAVRQTENLLRNQHMWNKPPDEDDLIADEFKHDPGPDDDEDYGYDIYEGGEYDDG